MLTKNDLEQIREVVRDEVKSEVGSQLKPIKTEWGTVKTEIATVKTELGTAIAEVGTQLKVVEKRLSRKIHKMQNSVIQYHDEYAIYLRERIEKLEEHTGLVKSNKN